MINKLFTNEDKTAILTTHSMEEAEALCQRIGIMTKGELKYFNYIVSLATI